MGKKMELTIVVPIYNVEEYLEKCLNSIYPLNIKKEIILINDGSKDSSLEIAQKFEKQYPEETVLISKKNGGLSSARNVGLQKARGEYIYFLDSDDFILPEEFETLFSEIQGTDLEIIHGRGMFYKNGNCFLIQEKLPKDGFDTSMTGKEYIYKMFELDCYVDYVWLNIYKKDYLLKNNFYFEEGITFEDVVFSTPVYWNASKIKQSRSHFYCYRIRQNSITQQAKKPLDHMYVYNFILDYVLEQKIRHSGITRLIISRIRKLAKEEKMFNGEIYQKLWKLPQKNWNSVRNLLDLFFRKYTVRKVSYKEIQEKNRKN